MIQPYGSPGWKSTSLLTGLVIGLVSLVLAVLVYNGILWPNKYLTSKYSVKGIDISAHQGLIDWGAVRLCEN